MKTKRIIGNLPQKKYIRIQEFSSSNFLMPYIPIFLKVHVPKNQTSSIYPSPSTLYSAFFDAFVLNFISRYTMA
jgi:hypothetical protein